MSDDGVIALGDAWLFADLDRMLRFGLSTGVRAELLECSVESHRWNDEDAVWIELLSWFSALNQIVWLGRIETPLAAAGATVGVVTQFEIDEADPAFADARFGALDAVCPTRSLRAAHDANMAHAREHGSPASIRDARMFWGTAGQLAGSAHFGRPVAPHPSRVAVLDAVRPVARRASWGLVDHIHLTDVAIDAVLAAPDADRLTATAMQARDAHAAARSRLGEWYSCDDEGERIAMHGTLDGPPSTAGLRLHATDVSWHRPPREGEDVEQDRALTRTARVLALTPTATRTGIEAVERWLALFDLARTSLGERVRQRYIRAVQVRDALGRDGVAPDDDSG